MSFVSFRKTFFPTGEEMKALEKRMEEIHSQCVEDRKNVKLVQDKKDPFYIIESRLAATLATVVTVHIMLMVVA